MGILFIFYAALCSHESVCAHTSRILKKLVITHLANHKFKDRAKSHY